MAIKKLTATQSIKQYCRYSCCANDLISWKECSFSKCPLFPYRLGKRPKIKPFSEYTKKGVDLVLNSSQNSVLNKTIGEQKPEATASGQASKEEE